MNHMQQVEGYRLAAAITSGLAAYFLSLPDLADYWRLNQGNIPTTMIAYLQTMSYRRYGAEKSLWNGMDAYSTRHIYDRWTGCNWESKVCFRWSSVFCIPSPCK